MRAFRPASGSGQAAASVDAAIAASTLAAAWPDPLAGLNARTYGPSGLEDDIRHCAQVDYLSVVPRFTGMKGAAAEIRGDHD